MKDSLDKLLGLSDLEKYSCVLWRYTASLSQLYIRLFTPKAELDRHLYLGFHSVIYFSGPTKWIGANFRLGNGDEIKSLIETGIIDVPEHVVTEFSDNLKLYVMEKSKLVVVILTRANVQIINEPINFEVSSQ